MIEEIILKIKAAGVVGAGGAGFPTAVKLGAKPEYVVVNGAECEPLLKVDQQLAEIRAAELLETLALLVSAVGAKKGIFALKEHYHGAVAALKKELGSWPDLAIKTLDNSYPMGDEQVLVYEVLGRIVPEGGIPLATGAVVVNVETLLNIRAALEGQAVTRKYVTVTGAVKEPATFLVPLGLSWAELIKAAGGVTVADPVVIDGGPMMGRLGQGLANPVTKTTKGLIVLNKDHSLVVSKSRNISDMMRLARAACCHCMLCTELCPRHLLGHGLYPDKLMRLCSYGSTVSDLPASSAFLCCECGLCEQACVMGLQPWRLNRELKRNLSAKGVKNPHHEVPQKVHPFRAYRQYPINRLIQKVGLGAYAAQKAPLKEYPLSVESVTLPYNQHLGAPARPVVALGDRVTVGQVVAAPVEGALGAFIHASLDGVVKSLEPALVISAH